MIVVWSAVLGLYSLAQLFAVGYIRLTISWKTLAYAILVGLYACTAVAYALEFLAVHAFAAAGVANAATVASYTVDPLIEETVKAAPLVLLALIIGRSLRVTDMLILGAGTGLGFRFAEEWLRLARGIDPHLPSAGVLLGWLPSGQEVNLSVQWSGHQAPIQIAGALVWTGLVGWAIGVCQRKHARAWLAVPAVVLAWVTFDHALANFSVAQASGPVIAATAYPAPLFGLFIVDGFGGGMRYYLLVALLLAIWLDWRRVKEKTLPSPRMARNAVVSWLTLAILPLWIAFAIVFLLGSTPVVPRPWTIKTALANPIAAGLFLIAGSLVSRSLRGLHRAPVTAAADGDSQVRHTLWSLLSYGLAGSFVIGLTSVLLRGFAGFFLHGGAHLYQAAQGTDPITIVSGLAPGLQALLRGKAPSRRPGD